MVFEFFQEINAGLANAVPSKVKLSLMIFEWSTTSRKWKALKKTISGYRKSSARSRDFRHVIYLVDDMIAAERCQFFMSDTPKRRRLKVISI